MVPNSVIPTRLLVLPHPRIRPGLDSSSYTIVKPEPLSLYQEHVNLMITLRFIRTTGNLQPVLAIRFLLLHYHHTKTNPCLSLTRSGPSHTPILHTPPYSTNIPLLKLTTTRRVSSRASIPPCAHSQINEDDDSMSQHSVQGMARGG
jgi:hypothetical protein